MSEEILEQQSEELEEEQQAVAESSDQETGLSKSHKDKKINNGKRGHQTNSPDSLHR